MWLDNRIIKYRENLTRNDNELLEEINKIANQIADMNITEVAKILHTSTSSISRLAQKLGFKGYSEFRYHFKLNDSDEGSVDSTKDIRELLKKDIQDTIKLAEVTDFQKIVKHIMQAQIVYCYGTGNSQKKALEEFGRLMVTLNKRVIIIPINTELGMTLSSMSDKDVMIVASLRGNSRKIDKEIQQIKEKNVPLIALTKFSQNHLSDLADVSHFYYATEFYDYENSRSRVTLLGLHILLDWIYRECFLTSAAGGKYSLLWDYSQE